MPMDKLLPCPKFYRDCPTCGGLEKKYAMDDECPQCHDDGVILIDIEPVRALVKTTNYLMLHFCTGCDNYGTDCFVHHPCEPYGNAKQAIARVEKEVL